MNNIGLAAEILYKVGDIYETLSLLAHPPDPDRDFSPLVLWGYGNMVKELPEAEFRERLEKAYNDLDDPWWKWESSESGGDRFLIRLRGERIVDGRARLLHASVLFGEGFIKLSIDGPVLSSACASAYFSEDPPGCSPECGTDGQNLVPLCTLAWDLKSDLDTVLENWDKYFVESDGEVE